ncbi:MAG TPA: polysaccharide biosynthesis/export family protein [Devosiaceae bacterium]|nr:polysaccharide biosynthesis/export family protein [Devosiaceae bacterium]
MKLIALASFIGLAAAGPALAQTTSHLLPQTKLRLTVVQFMPTTGEYRRWDALGGDVVVAPDGTVSVPTLGQIPATKFSADGLAAEISTRLQAKLGLVDPPDTTVAIVEYPPIYLVGSVASPGQYPFRPGMTVLQAFALGGGQYRADGKSSPTDTIKLQSDLQDMARNILRANARVARLTAELSGAKEIAFPSSFDSNDPAITDIVNQERLIFTARRNELDRQVSALTDLTELYRAEIDVLEQKNQSIDDELKTTTQQQTGIKQLVEKGVATVGRQADVDRAVAALRSDRLDNQIATMTARQGLSEAARNLAKIQDDQQSQISVQLQAEQANLEHLTLNETTTMRLFRQATEFAADTDRNAPATAGLTYSVLRDQDGQPTALAASESTVLQPGDLVKVSVAVGPVTAGQGAGRVTDAPPPASESQL